MKMLLTLDRCKMEDIALANLIKSLQKQTDEEFFQKSN